MAEIKTTIVLDDKMSAALEDIKSHVLDIIELAGGITETFESIRQAAGSISTPIKEAVAATAKVTKKAQFAKKIFTGWKNAISGVRNALESTKNIVGRVSGFVQSTLELTQNEARVHQQLNTLVNARSQDLETARAGYYSILDAVKQTSAATAINTTNLVAGATALGRHAQEAGTIEKLIGSMADLSAGMTGTIQLTQQQTEQHAQMLGQALDGNYQRLEQMAGITFSPVQRELMKTGTEAERAALIVEMIGESFGGAAKKIAQNTPYGAIQHMNDTFEGIHRTVGELATAFKGSFAYAITPVIEQVGKAVKNASGWISENIDTVLMALSALGAMAVAVKIKFLAAWAAKFAPILALGTAITAAGKLLMNLGVSFGDILGTAMGVFMGIKSVVITVFTFVWELINSVVQAIAGLFSRLREEGCQQFEAIRERFSGVFMDILDIAINIVAAITNIFVDFANFFGHVFQDPVAAVKTLFLSLGERILSVIQPVARILDRFLQTDISGFVDNLQATLSGWRSSIMVNAGFEDINKHLDPSEIRRNLEGAWRQGREMGENIANSIEGSLNKNLAWDPRAFGEPRYGQSSDAPEYGQPSDAPGPKQPPAVAGQNQPFGGLRYDQVMVNAPGGMALRVYDPANREIRGEMVRLKEDVHRRRYLSEYKSKGRAPSSYEASRNPATVYNNITQNIYASPGMDEENLAKLAGQRACKYVADQILTCIQSDLLNGGGSNRGGGYGGAVT